MLPFESIIQLTLPQQVECRLKDLMLRQSEGKLNESERRELDLLVNANDLLTNLRAKAKAQLSAGPVGQTIRNGLPVILVPLDTPAIDPEAVRRFLQEAVF